jgi:hypothetical protein
MGVALVALFLSLGGVSYGVATGYIDSREIKNSTIREKDVRKNVLTGRSVRESRLGRVPLAAQADSANSAQIAGVAGEAANMKVLGGVRVAPSAANADQNAARAAATKIPIASSGALSVYAKCWAENDLAANPAVSGGIFVETTQPGSILSSSDSSLEGNSGLAGMLNPDTAETTRAASSMTSYSMTAVANMTSANDDFGFAAAAPDGRTLTGQVAVATKTGELAGGNGVYGPGPACVFTGFVATGGA